jgi:hypothetical protein
VYDCAAYRDKKVVPLTVRFSCTRFDWFASVGNIEKSLLEFEKR